MGPCVTVPGDCRAVVTLRQKRGCVRTLAGLGGEGDPEAGRLTQGSSLEMTGSGVSGRGGMGGQI